MASIFTKAQLRQLQITIGNLEVAKADIEEIANEARDKFDTRSDKWRDESDDGQRASSEIEFADDAAGELDTVINNLTSIEGTQA